MNNFTDWLLHIFPWSTWCLEVLECESGDFVCFLDGGGWVEEGLWEVSSSLIVKVLWKSEPKVMAKEVSGVRSLDVGCPSPSYLVPDSCTRSCDVLGCTYAWGCGWVFLGSQTLMLIQVSSSVFAQLCTNIVFYHHFPPSHPRLYLTYKEWLSLGK